MIQKNIRFYKRFLFIDLGRPEQPEKEKKEKKKTFFTDESYKEQ